MDPSSLVLGSPIAIPGDSGCGGLLAVATTDTAVLLTTEVRGRAYFQIDTRFRTGEVAKAPDGSDLPPLLARVDGATGAVTAASVARAVHVAAGQLVADIDADRSPVIDPTTLAATEVPAATVAIPDEQIANTGATAWTFEVDDAGSSPCCSAIRRHQPSSAP